MGDIVKITPVAHKRPEQAIHCANNEYDLEESIIAGYDTDGEFVFVVSEMSNERALWIIEAAKRWVTEGK